MIKDIARRTVQRLLGFERYLRWLAVFHVCRIRWLGGEKAFRFFVGMIREEGVVLDIGANIGINTVILAKRLPGRGIHAFEPVPVNHKILQQTTAWFGCTHVRTYPVALGDREGQVELLMPVYKGSRMQGWSRIWKEGETSAGEKFTVPMHMLDSIEALQYLPVAAIKIDVENHEYFVLKGAMQLLLRNRPLVFCELWNDERRSRCIALMQEAGYRVMIYRNGRLEPHRGEDALNYFFLP